MSYHFTFPIQTLLILLHFNSQQATLKDRKTWLGSWGFSHSPLPRPCTLLNTVASISDSLAMCSNARVYIIGSIPRGLVFACFLFLIHCQMNL